MITLIHPSKGRPKKAFSTFQNWIDKSSGNYRIEHILSIDNDDFKPVYLNSFDDSQITFILSADNNSVVEATNRAANIANGKILVYLSDDFDCPENWDEYIVKKIGHADKVMLHINDGLQKMENTILTIPIMTRKLYKELGYFFYPEYKSIFCDNDLYHSTKQYMIDSPELVFKHHHHSIGLSDHDETYKQSEENYNQGLEIFNRRAKQFNWVNVMNGGIQQ